MDINKDHNPYDTPHVQVTSTDTSKGITPVIAEVLSSAAIWARFTSIVNWVSFAMTVLSIVFIFDVPSQNNAAILGAVGLVLVSLPQAFAYWYYARSMGFYASSAKALRDGVHGEDDVAHCFASSSTFMKTTFFFFFLFITIIVIGMLVAIAMPAYHDYVMPWIQP